MILRIDSTDTGKGRWAVLLDDLLLRVETYSIARRLARGSGAKVRHWRRR